LKDLYTVPELRTIIDSYVNTHSLVHPREPAFITLDDTLRDLLLGKNEELDFLKREELTPRLRNVMQPWYSISVNDKEPVIKKGELKPIAVICKIRQGRKVSTFITGFEPFSISSEFLCEELRKLCASATSVTPLPGKTAGQEVMVQGAQIPAVSRLLLGQGVPKKWIETNDLSNPKKK